MSGCHELETWHHALKHQVMPDGIERFPTTNYEYAQATLWQAMGYLGTEAIDLSDPDDPQPVKMPEATYRYMASPEAYHLEETFDEALGIYTRTEARRKIALFFVQFAIGYVDPSHVEVFRVSRPNGKHGKSMNVLRAAFKEAFGPMDRDYQRLLKASLIRSDFPTAPQAAFSFVEPRRAVGYVTSEALIAA